MNEPIAEFQDETQAYECLKEWQSRLFLDDWVIKINIKSLSELGKDGSGKNNYEATLRSSIIDLYKSDGAKIMCHELTLVHELLHLKFIFSDCVKNTLEGNFFRMQEHMLIEQLAKSFIMAKYNLMFEWFKSV